MKLINRLMIVFAAIVMLTACFQSALAQTEKSRVKKVSQKAVQPPAITNEARITFEHDSFDYGIVPRGEYVTHHFPVKNTGVDTLTITKIKPGCGCTTTRKKSIVIPPGESSSIDITYRSSKSLKQRGKATKRIRIESTDSSNPQMQLSISATTDTSACKVISDPFVVNFDQVLIGKDAKLKIDLTNIDTQKNDVVVIGEPTDEYIDKYKIKKTSLKPGQKTEIEFQIRDDIAPGDFKTGLTLQVGDDTSSRITIPISGKIVEKISEVSSIGSKSQTKAAPKSIKASNVGKANATKINRDAIAGSKTDSKSPSTIDDTDMK